jgi:outer membrane biosynthesis protein TonB
VLPEATRGKVTVGDTTILFQRVRPPPPRPRPQLPASVRRHVLAEIDVQFAVIAALTFLLHVALVVYLRQVDWPRRPAIDELPDRFVHDYLPRPRPAAPQIARPAPAPLPTPARRPRPAPRPKDAVAVGPGKPVESDAERHARLANEVQKMGVIAFLTAKSDGPSLATTDLLQNGLPDRAAEEALDKAGGLVAAGDEALRLPRPGGGTGKVATPLGLRGHAEIADGTSGGPVVERRAVGADVQEWSPTVEDGHVDAAAIAREVRGRRKAIAACYERALKQQPTLSGKVVLRFALAAAGTVTSVEIDDDTLGAPEVAACIKGVVSRWRFPALAEGAEVSFPFVFQPGG